MQIRFNRPADTYRSHLCSEGDIGEKISFRRGQLTLHARHNNNTLHGHTCFIIPHRRVCGKKRGSSWCAGNQKFVNWIRLLGIITFMECLWEFSIFARLMQCQQGDNTRTSLCCRCFQLTWTFSAFHKTFFNFSNYKVFHCFSLSQYGLYRTQTLENQFN